MNITLPPWNSFLHKWETTNFASINQLLTLCDSMDYTVPGILQARILEWIAVPSPGDLPNPGVESRWPALQADSLPADPTGKPINQPWHCITVVNIMQWDKIRKVSTLKNSLQYFTWGFLLFLLFGNFYLIRAKMMIHKNYILYEIFSTIWCFMNTDIYYTRR